MRSRLSAHSLTVNWTLAANPAGQTAVRLSAVPMLLGQTGQIQVTMQVTASQSIASLTPPANLGVVADGVTYSLVGGGPTPPGPVALTPGTPVYFTYVYNVTPGTQPGSIQFNGKPTASGIQFATAFSEGVIVTPALTFKVTVDGPASVNVGGEHRPHWRMAACSARALIPTGAVHRSPAASATACGPT